MTELAEYISRAKRRHGLRSDRALCRRLELSDGAIFMWTGRGAFPRDDTMVRLADLAGLDPELALLELNIWRSEGAVRDLYKQTYFLLKGAKSYGSAEVKREAVQA